MKNNAKLARLLTVVVGSLAAIGLSTNAQTFETVYNLSRDVDGDNMEAGLVDNGNTLFGVSEFGGTNNSGTVFALNIDGNSFGILHSFAPYSGLIGNLYNDDGVESRAQLLFAGNRLYGTTATGGSNSWGTVFAINADGTSFTNLYIFAGNADGGWINAGLALSGNNLYGVAGEGGTNGNGTIFSLRTDGTGFTVLHTFPQYHFKGTEGLLPTNSEGISPEGTLRLQGDTLYGTTGLGGTNGWGTIFAISITGSNFTVMHAFTYAEGTGSYGELCLAGDALYGVGGGGTYSNGTIYAINTDGTGFRKLHDFTGGNDGGFLWGGLSLCGDTLFGSTVNGGTNGNGTLFAIRTDGTGFVSLHSFAALFASPTGYVTNIDGASPYGSLMTIGNTLYGTTAYGGADSGGTLFSLALPIPPQLAISSTSTNVVLTWPTNTFTYTLQSTPSLIPPVLWNAVSPPPTIVNGQNTVTNPLAATQMFYRLSQ